MNKLPQRDLVGPWLGLVAILLSWAAAFWLASVVYRLAR